MHVSLIAPVHNEAGNLEPLADEIAATLRDLPTPWELIFVDDGSRDASLEELRRIETRLPNARVLALRRNFGQTAALSAGIDAAAGTIIVTLDADRQNDPADIPKLLHKMAEGYDVVSGWRRRRQDPFFSRTLPSRIANGLISWFTGVHLHDYGCSLKAYDADTLKSFRLYGEMHRFLPALCTWRGARIAEIEVEHRPRTVGTSKYGLSRISRVLLDLMTVKFLLEYSTKPMRVFGTPGLLAGAAGLAISLYLSYLKLALGQDIGHRPLLTLGILLIIVGIQLVMLGLLGELMVRIYYESQGKTVYQLAKRKP